MFLRQPLPLRPRARLHQRRHSLIEQIVVLIHVDDVEDDALVLLAVVDGEVEPEAMARVTSVGSKAEVVLELTNEENIPEVAGLKRGIET